MCPPALEGYIKCQAYDSVTNEGLAANVYIVPPGASLAELTPVTTKGLAPVSYTITFSLDGYNSKTVTVTVKAGETVNAYGSMVKEAPPVVPGFDINVNIPGLLPNSKLYVNEVVEIPFTDTWWDSPFGPAIHWDNIANDVYKARELKADCSPTPQFFAGFKKNQDYVIYIGTSAISLYPGKLVHHVGDATIAIDITESYVDWVSTEICGFFDISPAECPFFFATFYDPVFVAELLEIIINHKNLAGEPQEPTTLDYVLLPIAVAGSVLPIVPAGKLGKYAGLFLKRCKESTPIKTIFETRGEDIVEMGIKATTSQADTFVDAVKSGDTIKMLHTIDEVLDAPPTTIGHEWEWMANVKSVSDETHRLVKKAVALTPIKAKRIITAVHSKMLSKVIDRPPLYRFAKEDNILITKNLFEATYQNALRRESLTPTELASISQLAHNNPEIFARELGKMTDSGFNLFKKALKDGGGFDEVDLVEYARAVSKEGVLDNRGFNILSRMLSKQPMAKLVGTDVEVAEQFIKEFPGLSGERVLAELALMPADFVKNNPGVRTAAVDRLKVTKQFSDWEATKAIEGTVSKAIMHYIKRVPSEAAKHPFALMSLAIAGTFTITGGVVSYIGMGIAPMWFIEETPQTFSIPIYSAIKEGKQSEAIAMMGPYKDYLNQMEDGIVPWTKKWFFLWAPFVDLAMVAHRNQYTAYELLLGMNTVPPDVPEIFNAKVTDLIDADSMHIGVSEDEINEETGWRVVIEKWNAIKVSEGFNENAKPDIPLNYEIRLLGVNAPESGAENYIVRRLLCPTCDTEKWNATKAIYNKANDWAHLKLWHETVEMRTDQSNLLDLYNRILVVIYDGTENINTGLLKNGHAVVSFYSMNNKVDEPFFIENELIAKNSKIGIWSVAVPTPTPTPTPVPEGKIHCKTLKPTGVSLSGAKIYLTGGAYSNQYMGDTEKTITIPTGTYSVKYTYPGYQDCIKENIKVYTDQLADATCMMSELPDTFPVIIESVPSGATITVD